MQHARVAKKSGKKSFAQEKNPSLKRQSNTHYKKECKRLKEMNQALPRICDEKREKDVSGKPSVETIVSQPSFCSNELSENCGDMQIACFIERLLGSQSGSSMTFHVTLHYANCYYLKSTGIPLLHDVVEIAVTNGPFFPQLHQFLQTKKRFFPDEKFSSVLPQIAMYCQKNEKQLIEAVKSSFLYKTHVLNETPYREEELEKNFPHNQEEITFFNSISQDECEEIGKLERERMIFEKSAIWLSQQNENSFVAVI